MPAMNVNHLRRITNVMFSGVFLIIYNICYAEKLCDQNPDIPVLNHGLTRRIR